MKTILLALSFLMFSSFASAQDIYEIKVKNLKGQKVDLAQFKGKPLVIVNTASKCGYTDQYASLEKLYQSYKAKGLMVIGVPSNSFKQELDKNEKIAKFCQTNYGVSFPLLAKSFVAGDKTSPLFKFLTSQAPKDSKGSDVAWNFEKFLVGRDGKVKHRFRSATNPMSKEFIKEVEKLL